MATGVLFKAVDRSIPTLAAKRAHLVDVIIPRIQEEMARTPYTDEQITRYRTVSREKARYEHAKRILASSELQVPYSTAQLQTMEAFVAAIEADPQKMDAFARLERIGDRVQRFLDLKRYLEQGPPGMDDTRLQAYLDMKRAQSYMRHDPIEAFPEAKMGADCSHPRMYGVLFDGLELEEAKAYCTPAPGDPKTSLKRQYRLRFAQLPQAARDAILQGLVPRVAWNSNYMVLKSG